MIHTIKLFFWFLIARFFDWYARLLMRIDHWRYGVCARESSITREDILKATDTANPRRCFDYFEKRTSNFSIQEKTENLEDGLTRSVISFPSSFLSLVEANNTAQAALYRNKQSKTSLVVIFIGLLNSSYNFFEHWMAKTIALKGIDCCLIELPYHQSRSLTPLGGHCYIAEDPVASAEAWIQSVMDVDRLYQILREKYHYERIGSVGASIGGNIAHVNTFLRPYEGAVLIINGVSVADVVWQAEGKLWTAHKGKVNRTYAFADIQTLWAMSDVSKFSAPNLCSRFLMINGLFDKLFTKDHARRLDRTLGQCPMIWYPASHSSALFLRGPPLKIL